MELFTAFDQIFGIATFISEERATGTITTVFEEQATDGERVLLHVLHTLFGFGDHLLIFGGSDCSDDGGENEEEEKLER
ncbi:hypothetical protein IEQ34_001364 [Dendrobium chrysotoxum]|uniref:Uncharacterized protein n=1 Tax=Dendrobium chrysotoxum TaxID=161865 RepID=A0AAV7FII5_DENCH|nr:hypothetical protein IEQ34_026770 [Dendrobium chrysotoxum]KAH0469806.1 hypothetical protein IEQ34_001364 [Dendrobium chrysotoxum]